MVVRTSAAEWHGRVPDGGGCVSLGSGAFEGSYSFGSRFEEEAGTNPEELLGAAHASCFSMALSLLLTEAGFTPTRIRTVGEGQHRAIGQWLRDHAYRACDRGRRPGTGSEELLRPCGGRQDDLPRIESPDRRRHQPDGEPCREVGRHRAAEIGGTAHRATGPRARHEQKGKRALSQGPIAG